MTSLSESLPTRRRFLEALAVGPGACLAGPLALCARDVDPERTAGEFVTPEAIQAIDRGLAYLAGRQAALPDGAFGPSGYARNVAVVSLATMAFMAGGNMPGRGRYGGNVNRAADYVASRVEEGGFIAAEGESNRGPMYGHGFGTLLLAEGYGMTTRDDLRDKLDRAVKLIVSTQNEERGWRYQPVAREADLSVTACQVVALRAARNAGIHVPPETIERAVDYVKNCQNEDGGFMYMLPRGDSGFARSAAAIAALQSAAIYDGPEIESGLAYLDQFIPRSEGQPRDQYFFYGHYYAVQAMWHAGGQRWANWYPAIRDLLVALQRDDGSWMDAICPEYGTAMAMLILQVPNNVLPIFQR